MQCGSVDLQILAEGLEGGWGGRKGRGESWRFFLRFCRIEVIFGGVELRRGRVI